MPKKLQRFRVQKRFNVWAEIEITAPDIDTALAEAKSLDLTDFFTAKEGVEVNDWSSLLGTGVQEI